MGTTRTLADGEAFVTGRSQDTAAKLTQAANDLDLKGSVKTTYDGYIAPVEVVDAAGLGDTEISTVSSTPERGEGAPIDPLEASPKQAEDGDVPQEALDATDGKSIEDAGDAKEEYDTFDPTSATIAEVEAYLADASDDERARVIAAEQESSKPRKGVLDLAATQEGK